MAGFGGFLGGLGAGVQAYSDQAQKSLARQQAIKQMAIEEWKYQQQVKQQQVQQQTDQAGLDAASSPLPGAQPAPTGQQPPPGAPSVPMQQPEQPQMAAPQPQAIPGGQPMPPQAQQRPPMPGQMAPSQGPQQRPFPMGASPAQAQQPQAGGQSQQGQGSGVDQLMGQFQQITQQIAGQIAQMPQVADKNNPNRAQLFTALFNQKMEQLKTLQPAFKDLAEEKQNQIKNAFEQSRISETQRRDESDEKLRGQQIGLEGQRLAFDKDKFAQTQGDADSADKIAKSIANYQTAPLSGYAMRSPAGQKIMSKVLDMNPDYDGTRFAERSKAVKDFGTGPLGKQTRSFSVATSHLNTLEDLADALNNKDSQALNKAANAVQTQFGYTGATNFNTAKRLVADEIVKVVTGGAGALGDRESADSAINAAQTPEQLKGVISTYKSLMAGQLRGFKQQYQQSTGLDNFEDMLSDETRTELGKLPSGGSQQGAVPVSGGQPTATGANGEKYVLSPDGKSWALAK